MRSVVVTSAAALLVTACSGAGAPQRISAPASTSATLSLKSALVAVPDGPGDAPHDAARDVPRDVPRDVTVSCRGGGLCRETIAPPEAKDAIDEAKEDCADRGGLLGSDPCPRKEVRASCSLGGGAGPIRVFGYDDGIVSRMNDLCAAADGEFEEAAR